MRKWSFVLFCLTALAGLVLLVGCEGDAGLTGGKGAKGRWEPSAMTPIGCRRRIALLPLA